jgi:hypothetical protein
MGEAGLMSENMIVRSQPSVAVAHALCFLPITSAHIRCRCPMFGTSNIVRVKNQLTQP